MSAGLGGLGVTGQLIIVGAVATAAGVGLPAHPAVGKGWYSGTATDSQDTVNFSVLEGVRSMNEVYPLEKFAEAYERMASGKSRFRVVLTMS